MNIDKDTLKNLIIQGYTIPELQKYFGNCSRAKIAEHKRIYGFVGLSPNSKKLNREVGEKLCHTCHIVKDLKEFYSNGRTSTGLIKYKPNCSSCENLIRKTRFYTLVEEYLNTKNLYYKCSKCEDTDSYGFLEFHHIDPNNKDFNIGNVPKSISEDYFLDFVVPELDKCVLLCPSCHKREHILMGAN